VELGERALRVGEVVQHGVAEHQVEGGVGQGEALRVARRRFDLEPDAVGVGGQRREHPRRDVRADGLPQHVGEHQIQREVAGARADLQTAGEDRQLAAAQRLAQLAENLPLPGRTEFDAPLAVVLVGRCVVIAGVDLADLRRCGRGRHGGREL
jgi:hypothetical protein